ncbi:protein kinase domain-containing protein [Kitasatospora sp. NPDC054939]
MSDAVAWASAVEPWATSLAADAPVDPGLATAAAPVAVVVARQAIFHAHAVAPEKSLAVAHVESLANAFTALDPHGVGALLDFWHFAWTGRFATGTFLGDDALPHALKLLLQPAVSAGGRPALQAAQGGLLHEARRRLTAEAQEAAAANRVMGKELFLRPLQAFTEDGPDACLLLAKSPADAVKAINNALLKPLTMGGVRYQQTVETAARIAARMREVVDLTTIVRQSPPPRALRLGVGDVAQLSAPARGLLPLVLLDLTEGSTGSFDVVPVLALLEEHLAPLETEEVLRPALALGETGRTGGVAAEAQTYLTSIRGRLDGVARHIGESPELMELLEEVRAEVAQGRTGQVDSLIELARPLVLRGRRLERIRALSARLAEAGAGTAEADEEEQADEAGAAVARLSAIVETAGRTEDEEAAAQLLAMAEEMVQQLAPGRTAGGRPRARTGAGSAAVHGGEPVRVPPVVLLAELLEDTWHPMLPRALRSVTDPREAAEAFEELAVTGSGPVQRAAAVCAVGWSVLSGRPEDALRRFGRLAKRVGRSATWHWNEGCARSALGDLDGAVAAFEAVARLGDSPPHLVVQPVLDLFQAAGRPCPFRPPLKEGAAPDARIDILIAQRFEATAKQLRLNRRTADAELLLEALTEVSPMAPGRSLLMKIYREEHRLVDAERFVSRMGSRGAADWMLDFDLALVAVDSGASRRAGELRDRLVAAGAPEQHLLQLDRRIANSWRPASGGAGPVAPRPVQPPRAENPKLPPILLHEDLLVPASDTLPDGLRAALTRTDSPLEAAHAFAAWSADAPTPAVRVAAAVCAVGWACRAGVADLAADWAHSLVPADASGWVLWNRACALGLLQDVDGAARVLERALSSGDQPPQSVWPLVVEFLTAAGRPVSPQSYSASASGPRPPARVSSTTVQQYESLAKQLYTVNRQADAEVLLRALVEAAPRAPGRLLLMRIWREGRRLDDALTLVSQRRALGEEDWRLCYETGLVAVAAGRQSVALDMRGRVVALGGPADWIAQLDRRIGIADGRSAAQRTGTSHVATPEQHIVQRALNGPQNKPALLEPARRLLDEQGPLSVLSVARQLERAAPWACLTLLDLLIDRVAEQPDHEAPAGLAEQVLATGDAKPAERLASVLEELGDGTEAARLLTEAAERCRPTQRPRIWHRLIGLLRTTGQQQEADRLAARTRPPLPARQLEPDPGRAVPLRPRLTPLVLPAHTDGESSSLHRAQELEQLHGAGAAADAWCAALEAGHVLAYPHALGTLVAAGRAEEALELYRRYADQLWTGPSSAWNIAAAYAGLGLLEEAADALELEARIGSRTAPDPEERARLEQIFRAVGRPSPGGLITARSASAVGGSTPVEPTCATAGSAAAATREVPASPAAPPREAPATGSGASGPRFPRIKPGEWEDRAVTDVLRRSLLGTEPGSPGFAQLTQDLRALCTRLVDGLAGEAERFVRPAPRPLTQDHLDRMGAAARAAFAEGLEAAQEDRWHDAARAWRTAYDAHPRNEVIAADLALALVRTGEQGLGRQLADGFLFSAAFIRPRTAVAHACGGSRAAVEEIIRMRTEDLALGRTELPLAQAGLELHHLQDAGAAARTLLSVATERPPGLGRLFAVVALLLGQDAGDGTVVEQAYRCLIRPMPHINEIVHAALQARRPDHLTLVPGLLRGSLLGKVANARSEELRREQPSHRRLQLMRALLEQRRGSSPEARWLYARMLWQDGDSPQAALAYKEVVLELSVRPGRPNLATAVEEWIQAARSSGDPATHRDALSGKQELGLPMRTRELEILRGDEVAHESLLLDLNAEVVSFEAVDVVDAPLEAVHRLERVAESVRSVAFGSQDEVTVDQLIDVWYHQLAQDIGSDEGRARLMDLRKQALDLCRRVGDPTLREVVQRVSKVTYRLWEESGRRLLPARAEAAFTVTETELWCHGDGPLHVRLTVEPHEDDGRVRIGCNGLPHAEVELGRGRQRVVFRVDELCGTDRVELDFALFRPGETDTDDLKIAYPVETRSERDLGGHAFVPTSPAHERIRVPRESELAQLRHHYSGRPVAPVRFLHGPRQVGKTTLARSLMAHPLPENPAEWPIPGLLAVDVNGELWIPGEFPPLWTWLAEEIVEKVGKSWRGGTHSPEPLPETGYAFRKWLTGIRLEGLDDWRLLLMVDEFQKLLDRVNESGQSIAHLGDQLRGMATDPAVPLLLLTLGSCSFESLKDRLTPYGTNLTGEIIPFPVGFMEPDQARLILRRGFDDSVFLQQAAVERLVEYTGGYPYHVHCMGEQLAAQLGKRKASIITPQDVELAAQALVQNPEVIRPIADLQSEPGVERAVSYLLENATASDETVIDGDAVDMVTDPEVDRGLDRIKDLGLIRRDGHSDWVWSNLLIHRWLRERHARQRLKARVGATEPTGSAAHTPEPSTVEDPAESLRRAGFVLGEALGQQEVDGFAAARKVTLNGHTAVAKLLNPTGDPDQYAALQARFDTLQGSVSSGVPRLLRECGVVGKEWFVFEWTEGRTLADCVRQHDRLHYDWQDAVGWVTQAADTVGRAYREGGLTHGDVKPENLVLAPDGRVTVLDWGGGNLGDQVSPVFRDHAFDERYTTPEQRVLDLDEPRGVLASDDAYSLAATLFELVHPERRSFGHCRDDQQDPFGQTGHSLLENHFLTIRKTTSLALSSVLREALNANPSHRFENAEELATELRRVFRA